MILDFNFNQDEEFQDSVEDHDRQRDITGLDSGRLERLQRGEPYYQLKSEQDQHDTLLKEKTSEPI